MFQIDIEKYFTPRGIDVSYNTLGSDESLYRSFVNEFQPIIDNAKRGMSQYAKGKIYNTIYDIEPRPKMTGFEYYKKLDLLFRDKARQCISNLEWVDSIELSKAENTLAVGMSYKDQLKAKVRKFKNPLLYLSGGIDSELVACTMIDTKVKFTPVIFSYIDYHGNVLNSMDISYAYKFCKKFNLVPITKKINIEQLWGSDWFFQKAVELGIVSPHIVTHYHMVEMMEHEFPGVSHVFGGEARVQSSLTDEFGEKVNLIKLGKQGLPGNGGTFVNQTLWGSSIVMTSIFAPATGLGGTGSMFIGGSNQGTWFVNTFSPNFYENRASNTWKCTSTLNSINADNGAPYTFRNWSRATNWEGWANPAVGATLTVYDRPPTFSGPGVRCDAITTDVTVLANWTMTISSNGTQGNPQSPTLSTTYNTNALSTNP